jgi:hypothetical protein
MVKPDELTSFTNSVLTPLIGPGAVRELESFAPPGRMADWIGTRLSQLMNTVMIIKPVLMFVTLIMGLLALRERQPLLLVCVGVPIYHALGTSVALPGHFPYWFPMIPFVIIGTAFGARRVLEIAGQRFALRQPSGAHRASVPLDA